MPVTTYTIAAGQTSVNVEVQTKQDTLVEGNEFMSLRLLSATGAIIENGIGNGRGIGTIIDDDVAPPPVTHVSFYADPQNIAEGNDLVFHFHRDLTTSALDVKYYMGTFPAGGATPGVDFTADNTTFTFVNGDPNADPAHQPRWADPSMVVHFAAGQADANLTLHTVADHVNENGPEAFTVQFDFVANGPNVQYDATASNLAYIAAGALNPTQVNIGHIVDMI